MKQKELRYKISKKGYDRFAFPEVKTGSAEKDKGYQKKGKVFRAPGASAAESGSQSARNLPVALGFCAIKNFREILQRWSENREQLHACLNGFIGAVTEIVELRGGAVEKFADNGILFAFGYLEPAPDDLKNVLTAALKIRYRMNKLNRSWDLYHDDSWKVSVGAANGTAMVVREAAGMNVNYSFRGNLFQFVKGLGNSAHPSQIVITEAMYNDDRFPRDFVETKAPYHLQVQGTDYMTRVREVVAIVKGRDIV